MNILSILCLSMWPTAMILILMLALFSVIFYNGKDNRYVKKLNQALHADAELNRAELDRLGKEKEWLIKEIHHRVKNNLQIAISLLNTQANYLEGTDAALAVQESQHRMYAMALVHHQLYSSESISSIDMEKYIADLVGYLRDSYDLDRKINFRVKSVPTAMEIGVATPLGLFINEALTNAVKHAFTSKVNGSVTVLLESDNKIDFKLTITDNGSGMRPGTSLHSIGSLGANLMKGLSQQLEGVLSIQEVDGVRIGLEFSTSDVPECPIQFNKTSLTSS